MNKKASIFTYKMVKNIAISFLIFIIMATVFPYFSYGSQYRENTNLDSINDSRYPGYKQLIKALKSEHPNWTFTLFYTGLKWSDVIYNETLKHGSNLVQNGSGEWLCTSPSCLNDDGTPKAYEKPNWYCPSTKAISYYLDPRNFLYSNKVFQFERLSYSDDTYTVEGVEKILAGTFMANTSPRSYYGNNSYSDSSFAQIMFDAGVTKKVSPYHIASRIRQEVVKSGGGPSNSVTGTVSGYEGVYNFFNFGATTGDGAIERGLKYAAGKNWRSPESAIYGGAEKLAKDYISKGQDTLYLEKYNVSQESNSLYGHQYQANIQAAYSEGNRIYKSYSEMGVIDNAFNFVIPVYENMPSVISPYPNTQYGIVTENVVVKNGNTNINIRENKTTQSTSIARVNQGDVLLRIEQGKYEENGYIWDKVVLSNGVIGYISTSFVEKIADVKTCNINSITTTSTSLRNGPGTSKTETVRNLQAGEPITIIDKGKYNLDGCSWDRVQLSDGTQGYINSEHSMSLSGCKEGDIVKVATNSSPLMLRVEPRPRATSLRALPKGSYIIRIEENVANTGGIQWDKVKTFDGVEGYVSAEYLELIARKTIEQSSMDKISIDENQKLVKCEPNAKLSNLLEQNSGATLKDKNGNTITDTGKLLATGDIVTINGTEYKVAKLGDTSGDGIVDPRDSLRILRFCVGSYVLKDEFFIAGDINKDGEVDSRDSLRILRYTVSSFNIEL